jgi:CO/xanthine dehydrogenase FAD-binding subunit
MHEFHLERPADLDQCLDALSEYGEDASLLAGGTDLRVLMDAGLRSPAYVLDLGGISELCFMREEDGRHLIGATQTHDGVECGFRDLRCLSRAAGSVGSPQIRNMGTAGGNLANASPSGDLFPPLLALDAEVFLNSKGSERRLPLAGLCRGPGETVIEPDEMLTRITFPKPKDGTYTDFIKVGLRNALAISVASAAVAAEGDGRAVTRLAVACGAVAPTPLRMPEVEEMVTGREPSPELIEEAGRAARAMCCPISDIRGTAGYRRHVTGIIVSRLVEGALRAVAGYSGGA